MLSKKWSIFSLIVVFSNVFLAEKAATAQQFGGLLGVYAVETNYGLLITGFIPGSSAARLNQAGELMVGDIMTRMDDRPLRHGRDIFAVTDLLRAGHDFVSLDMVTRTGFPFRLAITPTPAAGITGAQPRSFNGARNRMAGDLSESASGQPGIQVVQSRRGEGGRQRQNELPGEEERVSFGDRELTPMRRPRD